VSYRNGAPVRLRELGAIVDGVEDERTASWFYTRDGAQRAEHGQVVGANRAGDMRGERRQAAFSRCDRIRGARRCAAGLSARCGRCRGERRTGRLAVVFL